MSRNILGLIVVAGTTLLVASPAFARDYEEHAGVGWRHIEHDQDEERDAAAKVEEEREELAEARQRLRSAWWNGDYWDAERARRQVQHEREELNEARHRLHEEQEEIERDHGYQYYGGHGYRHQRVWWWGGE